MFFLLNEREKVLSIGLSATLFKSHYIILIFGLNENVRRGDHLVIT